MLEDFYSVLGADLYRCQECAARFAFFRRFALPLGRFAIEITGSGIGSFACWSRMHTTVQTGSMGRLQ
jgi:hypothetical protein